MTAISIPDSLFADAERLARRTKKSRSQLYSDALREYVSRHSPDEMTEAWNRVVDKVGPNIDPFVTEAGRSILERSEW